MILQGIYIPDDLYDPDDPDLDSLGFAPDDGFLLADIYDSNPGMQELLSFVYTRQHKYINGHFYRSDRYENSFGQTKSVRYRIVKVS